MTEVCSFAEVAIFNLIPVIVGESLLSGNVTNSLEDADGGTKDGLEDGGIVTSDNLSDMFVVDDNSIGSLT